LWIEWGSVGLKGQVKTLEAFGIDPLYYSLHIGIDNAATGHGAMAKRAIEIYPDEVRASSGDDAMQETWRRIWNGYVAFDITGELAEYMTRFRDSPPDPA